MPVFMSSARFLRVTFPPEQFGMGEGVEEFYDVNGNKMKKRLQHRPAKFESCTLREEKPARVEMLRKHPGNMANGGSDFWEQSEADSVAVSALHGRPIALAPEGGMTAEDIEDLKYLKKADHQIPPRAAAKFQACAVKVHARFRIAGIAPPPEDFGIVRLRSRVIEILGVIADSNIWDGEDADAKQVDSGSGKRAHG